MRTRTRALALAGAAGIVASLALAAPASAAEGSNCWGVVSAQAAKSDGGSPVGNRPNRLRRGRLAAGKVPGAWRCDYASASHSPGRGWRLRDPEYDGSDGRRPRRSG